MQSQEQLGPLGAHEHSTRPGAVHFGASAFTAAERERHKPKDKQTNTGQHNVPHTPSMKKMSAAGATLRWIGSAIHQLAIWGKGRSTSTRARARIMGCIKGSGGRRGQCTAHLDVLLMTMVPCAPADKAVIGHGCCAPRQCGKCDPQA